MYKFKNGYYADVRIEYRYITDIEYRNEQLQDLVQRNYKGAFIRLYDGNMWYYSSTDEIDKVQEELNKLYDLAIYNEDILDDEAVKRYEVNNETIMKFTQNCVENIALEKKKALLQSYFPIIRDYEEIKLSTARYIDRYSVYEFYSSKGTNIKYDFQNCGLAFRNAMSFEKEVFQSFYQNADDNFDSISKLHQELKEALDESRNYLHNAKPVTPGTYEVILSPLAAGVFAHESFGHKSEADFMIGDQTMRAEWSIGKKVGSDILSIVDSGQETGTGYVPFDDEGNRATKTYLIKKGILAGRLHNSFTAKELEEEVTGNARAVNTDFEPIVRMTTTYIEGGDLSVEELFNGVKNGFYIKTIFHGSGMSTFTIAPAIAYKIENGKITTPAKISVITGNVFETLGFINGLSKDVKLLSFVTGGCGKMEQYPLNVGFGGPYVRVAQMKVQ